MDRALDKTYPAAVHGDRAAFFYRPELDCLRFFAFFAVFVHHSVPKTPEYFLARHLPASLANVAWAGGYGVDLFFCLSAYLITELLRREKRAAGHLNVTAFYIRRILRIWPLYLSFVAFAYALSFVDPAQRFDSRQLLMFLVLAGNWAPGLRTMVSVVVPLWSVSVEEQFYLLWPLVVRSATRKQMRMICFIMIAAAFTWRGMLQNRNPALIWNSTFSHLDSIGYGILLSLRAPQRQLGLWLRLGLVAIASSTWIFAASVRDREDIGQALVAIGSVAFLRAAIGVKFHPPVLVRLGVVSYGLYVYHEFFLHYLGMLPALNHGWRVILWWLSSFAATTLAALASYRWLETPFLRLKERFAVVRSRPI